MVFDVSDGGVEGIRPPAAVSLFGWPNTPMSPSDIVGPAVFWFILWSTLSVFSFRKFRKQKGEEYASRVVSLIHAFLSVGYSFYCVVLRWQQFPSFGSFFDNLGCFDTPILADEQMNVLMSAMYFSMDLIGICIGSYFDPLFIVHHVGAISGCFFGILMHKSGMEMAFAFFLLEGTNPFFHSRWLAVADGHNKDNSYLFHFLDKGFMTAFFILRVFIGVFVAYGFCTCHFAPLLQQVVGGGFYIFSVKFFYDVVQKNRRGEPWV